jgi:hypothetical protein
MNGRFSSLSIVRAHKGGARGSRVPRENACLRSNADKSVSAQPAKEPTCKASVDAMVIHDPPHGNLCFQKNFAWGPLLGLAACISSRFGRASPKEVASKIVHKVGVFRQPLLIVITLQEASTMHSYSMCRSHRRRCFELLQRPDCVSFGTHEKVQSTSFCELVVRQKQAGQRFAVEGD